MNDKNEDLLDQLLQMSGNGIDANSDIFKEEDLALFPLCEEIAEIEDQSIRLFVRAVLLAVDDHFWSGPSSTSGKYHPPDESGEGGLILHTKRVVRAADFLCSSQERTSLERDMIIAACILHDITKNVKWQDGTLHYDSMHPYSASTFIRDLRLADEENESRVGSTTIYIDDLILYQIIKMIRCHLGPWSPVPETMPTVTSEWIVHLADNMATQLHIIVDGENVRPERWTVT